MNAIRKYVCLAVISVAVATAPAFADGTYFDLSSGNFTQDWSNTGLITTNDDWSGVPSIIGYRGDGLTTATGVDPQTVIAESTVIDVNANQTDPTAFFTGGVTEFELVDPVVALTGSGTADAPYIQLHLNTTGMQDVLVTYLLRDIEAGADDAMQQVALQYRIGITGDFTNVPAGYITDATTGGSATQTTPVSVLLPAETANVPQLQVRIITTNAVGNDEWVGIDDIVVSATVIPEPATYMLMGIGLLVCAQRFRRKQR